MKKNGRSIVEDLRLIQRGVKEFEKLLPGQMRMVAWKCLITAVLPYVAVCFSTCIVNELTGAKRREFMVLFVLLSIGITFVSYAVKVILEAGIGVGYSRLFDTHELLLTQKAHRLPYVVLESNGARKLREQVSGSIQVSGAGMASLYWDMEVVVTNLCSAVISVLLCMGFLGELLVGSTDETRRFVPGYLLLLFVLVGVCSYVSCKMTGKRFDVAYEVFEEGAKYKRYGEFYTLEYLSDEDAALDVRIFGQEKTILEETYQRCYAHFAEGKKKEMRAVSRYDSVKLLCMALCGTAVYFLIGCKVLEGIIGIGNVVMLHAAVTGLIAALSELAQIWTDLRNNNEHLQHFFAYMDLPEVQDSQVYPESVHAKKAAYETGEDLTAAGAQPITTDGFPHTIEEICFEGVSFRYPDTDNWVLQDLNITIKSGEKLAIVGPNGSGKSTMIKLLCRLYEPTKGRILLNGRDIRSYSYIEYVQLLGTVFQDFSLFAFPLGENIAAGKKYDAQCVTEALQKVGWEQKLAELPKGLEQFLFHDFSEEGINVSGGEAQKLAIARALYKDAPIMILDEPTAALDPYAEYEIYQSFYELAKGKTLLSISHRLSSCRMCDRILVLESGKIVQSGSHEELVTQKQGRYLEMWQAQAQYYT
ncbi:MAG: ABC transporter ATP-binding protein [Lachnospiraceae bacterium]|nr:ABC transporter ATP-binding protein [Lachnospiraceae bacterium]